MNHKSLQVRVGRYLRVLSLGAAVIALLAPASGATAPASATRADYTPNTVITVTSGKDPDTSKSTTCASSPTDECTLRRAIVESRSKTGGQLPVLIDFDIPQRAAEGYDSTLRVWEIEVLSTSDPSVFRQLRGGVIIDGSTQAGGRSNGPRIILIGPGTG